jgi:hypothetical protein
MHPPGQAGRLQDNQGFGTPLEEGNEVRTHHVPEGKRRYAGRNIMILLLFRQRHPGDWWDHTMKARSFER